PGLCAVGPVRTVGRVRRGEREPRLRLAYRRERGRRRRRLGRGGPRHRPAFATFKEGAELMQTVRAAIALALVLFLGVWGAAAQADGPTVLASTSWTGAIAEAAGAAQVDILASFELRHPPERDFRPGDITRALAADVLLWAGYEGFMNQLIAAAEIPGDRVLQIRTENTPAHLVELTRWLARLWGTDERPAAWRAELLRGPD